MNNYWRDRSNTYNSIEYHRSISRAHDMTNYIKDTDLVLNAGCGIGILNPYINNVVGIDTSMDMLLSNAGLCICADCRYMPFQDNIFDAVVMRMVIHHILNDPESAISEAYRVLKSGGILLIDEGVPPTDDDRVIRWWNNIMHIKEERNNIGQDDIILMMNRCGFIDISKKYGIVEKSSVMNWIDNAVIDNAIKMALWNAHTKMEEYITDAYKAVRVDGDILLDMKYVIIKGVKL